ncbi:hypothetical protein Btru_011361 [Bulinus truncatus]|nr:hypothetical protein Btru_011361 [Bulinus truncatus]
MQLSTLIYLYICEMAYNMIRFSRRAGYSTQSTNDGSNTTRNNYRHLNRSSSSPITSTHQQSLEVPVTQSGYALPNSQNNAHVRFGRNLTVHQKSFTPKCLMGFNVQTILNGQGSVENFSRTCWLENTLHRFGQLSTDTTSNAINESDIEVTTVEETSDILTHLRMSVFHTVLRSNNLISSLSVENYCNQSNSSQDRSTSSRDSDSYMLNTNISGFAFDPEAFPPPYSELPQDPPPSYAESARIEYSRRAAGAQTSHSELLSNADYLY